MIEFLRSWQFGYVILGISLIIAAIIIAVKKYKFRKAAGVVVLSFFATEVFFGILGYLFKVLNIH